MTRQPLISLCVPTYNRINYLKRLLDSISAQTFKDYEIVITDNSDNDSVSDFIKEYPQLPIKYHKNTPPTTMAVNWNINISKANGVWLKMMHDDDWFATNDALERFAAATNTNARFLCCSWQIIDDKTGQAKAGRNSIGGFKKILKNPFLVFGDNIIGPPSVTMVHHSVDVRYNERMNWLVDLEYYIAVLRKYPASYIPETLINIGWHEQQATAFEFNNKSTEIREALILWNEYGPSMIPGIMNYDAWWRLMRKLRIKDNEELNQYRAGYPIPFFLDNILSLQNKLPVSLLKKGAFSKLFMSYSYFFHFKANLKTVAANK
ncbi:MAG: glycosyltransferase family 2 protein [Flavipsychrobacter sp.]